MSCSARVSKSNARSRSSREKRPTSAFSRSRSLFAGDLWIFDAGRIDREHEDVAHQPRELAADGAQVVPHLDRARGDRKRRGRVLGSDGVHGVE